MSKKRRARSIQFGVLSLPSIKADTVSIEDDPKVVIPLIKSCFAKLAVVIVLLILGIGVMAANGWLPSTDPLSGKKTGWLGRELPANAASSWNPFASPLPSPTPQLSKELIYAGSRLLAVEDANAVVGTPTPTPSGIEGDIVDGNGGPAGDGFVLANDVSVIRQMVLGNIPPPDPGSQYQRADTGPYDPPTTCGDGALLSGDVVVIRQYVLGNFPVTPACGPTGPAGRTEDKSQDTEYWARSVAEPQAATSSNRELRIGPATGRRGETVTLPVFMKMGREEYATSFTLEYDATRLSNPRLSLNDDLPESTVLTTNTTHPGKIGVLIDAETSLSTTPRELRIVFVTFDVKSNAVTGPTHIKITDSLAIRSVSDIRALLVTSYLNGDITLTN